MLSNKFKVGAIALSLSLIPLLTSCADKYQKSEYGVVDSQEIVSNSIAKAVSLSQGWDWDTQQKFWFTTQGSKFMPYKWFLWLEQESSTELFRSAKNVEKYKYIPQKATPLNPDGLPIGFANDYKGEGWVGLTCSACHTGQVNYGKTAMVIDGAPTMADFQTFFIDLEKAMNKTLSSDVKFERFAINTLGEKYSESNANELRNKFLEVTKSLTDRNTLNETKNPYGFARVDAFGQIFNMVSAHDLGVPENKAEPDAPVSYPFLWDTPQSNLVQWNGLLSNHGIGPLGRNVGEVLGVFGELEIKPEAIGYPSSANIPNLAHLEKWVAELWSPQWPMDYLGTIDVNKAEKGKEHYDNNCVSCHSIINRTDPKRRIFVTMVGLKEIGTDPVMATNAGGKGKTGILEGKKINIVAGEKFGAEAYKAQILTNAVEGAILRHPIEDIEALATDYLKIEKSDFNPIATPSYKARPLDGIWATAPYLHNGSIPNIWELLKPSEKRVKSFYVGSREFDPKHIGFDMSENEMASEFDTTLYNNSNAGHEYGTSLSDKEKWELMEFLKTL